MSDKKELIISEEKGRLDKVLSNLLPDHSRTQLKSLIDDNMVSVNGESVKSKYKVQPKDHIIITIPEPKEISTEPEDIPIEVEYEDSDLAVVYKPQGMVVHPSAGHYSGTLVNALLFQLDNLSGINGEIRPGIVHRIDKDTSGLLMIAKNDNAHKELSKQLKAKTTKREYIALVHGKIPHKKGTVDAPIGRSPEDRKKYDVVDNGKDAVTHFDVIEYYGDDYTLISCRLETGRTHQIRVHLNYIGFPIAGDPLYGPRKTLDGNGQFLHAKSIGFNHPTTNEYMEFDSEIPEIFKQTLKELKEKYK